MFPYQDFSAPFLFPRIPRRFAALEDTVLWRVILYAFGHISIGGFFMKKSTLFLTGMAALLLSFGLILAGCGDAATGDLTTPSDNGGNDLPLPPKDVTDKEEAKGYFEEVFAELTTDEEKAFFFGVVLEMMTENMDEEEKEALMDFLSNVDPDNLSLDDVPDDVWELVVDKWSDIKGQIEDLVNQENEDRSEPPVEDGGNELPVPGGDGGNELPDPKGANALSGKTYIDWERKIEFSTTAEGAASGTYEVFSVKRDNSNGQAMVDNNDKYVYVKTETGNYTWNDDVKTVTTAPEAIASRERDEYGALQSKADVRAAAQAEMQALVDQFEGEADFNAWLLKETGFPSVAAYLNYLVAEYFKNVTRNYALSADEKALFLDEDLPANKGTNELAGQTYDGPTWNPGKYVFTATDCTYTSTNNSYSQKYSYAYDSTDSTDKRVYLKIPTDDREAYYTQGSEHNNTNTGNFASADEYNAAQVNGRYGGIMEYMYDSTEKELGWW
jgi:hypothetical protein